MSMPLTLARRITSGRATLDDLREEAERTLGARSEKRRRKKPMRLEREKLERTEDERSAAFYEQAKREAAIRAGALFNAEGDMVRPPRCEFVTGAPGFARRCPEEAADPDHVVGGAYRKDSERLGADGLECLCRGHHAMKHANTPTRLFWIEHAESHAARHLLPRLSALVAKARARYEAKFPPPSPSPASPQETP